MPVSKSAPKKNLALLPKELRLRKRRDFLRIQRHGSKVFGAFVIVVAQQARDGCAKFGVTGPKKIGPAVIRNKLKRRVRHILRLNPHLFNEKHLVVITKESSNSADYVGLERDLKLACKRLRLQKPSQRKKPYSVTKVA